MFTISRDAIYIQELIGCRYIAQVRQEIAIRLHARLYPGGVGPSKVSYHSYHNNVWVSSNSV